MTENPGPSTHRMSESVTAADHRQAPLFRFVGQKTNVLFHTFPVYGKIQMEFNR